MVLGEFTVVAGLSLIEGFNAFAVVMGYCDKIKERCIRTCSPVKMVEISIKRKVFNVDYIMLYPKGENN